MSNKIEVFSFSNIAATPASFVLRGGNYGVTAAGTFGTVTLQRLAPDAVTYVTVMTAFAAAGYASANLPSGTYRLLLAGASAIYADVVSIATPL